MTLQLLDEIIDAIIQNEGRHVDRSGTGPAGPGLPRWSARPDWMQEAPGEGRDAAWPGQPRYAPPRGRR
jgi:hypothetical protein